MVTGNEQGCKPGLLIIPGWGLGSGLCQPLAKVLQSHFRVSVLTLPGYDGCPVLENTDLASLAAHCQASIPASGLVFGWSLGGMLALQMALDYPQSMRKLVCLGSNPRFVADNDWPGVDSDILAQMQANVLKQPNKALPRFVAAQSVGHPNPRQQLKSIMACVEQQIPPHPVALKQGLEILAMADLRVALQKLICPCDLLLAEQDTLVPVSLADKVAALSPHIHPIILNNTSHSCLWDQPEAVAQAIVNSFENYR